LFLRPDVSRLYAHPFSRARALLAEDDAAQAAQRARDSKEAERLRRSAAHHRNVGINSGSDFWLKRYQAASTSGAEAIEGGPAIAATRAQRRCPPGQSRHARQGRCWRSTTSRFAATRRAKLVFAPVSSGFARASASW
jgi:hypothetical protein